MSNDKSIITTILPYLDGETQNLADRIFKLKSFNENNIPAEFHNFCNALKKKTSQNIFYGDTLLEYARELIDLDKQISLRTMDVDIMFSKLFPYTIISGINTYHIRSSYNHNRKY